MQATKCDGELAAYIGVSVDDNIGNVMTDDWKQSEREQFILV